MPLKLNYKSVLTVFYNLLRLEYGAGIDFDNTTVGTAYITDSANNDLDSALNISEDHKENQLDSVLATLRVCGRIKRVKALAWVKKKMLINAHVLVEDSAIYRKVMKEFHIDENEVNQMMSKI